MSKSFSHKLLSLILSVCLIFSMAFPVAVNAINADTDDLKAAMDAAQAEFNQALAALDEAESKAVFHEDFEGETQKVGYRSGGASTKLTTEVVAENNNKYGKVTVNSGHAQSGYYGMLENITVEKITYKVVFDYKLTNTEIEKIQLWRPNDSTGKEEGVVYPKLAEEWTTYTYTTPQYNNLTSAVFYFQIQGANTEGTQFSVDNFLVLKTEDYDTYITAKANVETKKAALDQAKAAYEASLSPEELAYNKAKEVMNNAKEVLDEAESKAVFHEDFEGETKKVGVISGSNITETIVTDENGNKYAKLVSKGGGTYYGTLNTVTSTVGVKYTYAFDYKVSNAADNSVRAYRYNKACTQEAGYSYLNNIDDWTTLTTTADHEKTDLIFKISFLNASAGAEVLVDNFIIIPEADYSTYTTAKAAYEEAKAAYDTAKAAYEASLSPEELAYNKAKEAMNNAKEVLDEAESKAIFYEDFEGETREIGINGSNVTETIVTDENGNKYAKLVSSGGGTYYGTLNTVTSTVGVKYTYAFDYKVSNAADNSVRAYRYNKACTQEAGYSYLNNIDDWTTLTTTADHEKTDLIFKISFLNASAGAEVLVDNFIIIPEADYSTYTTAKAAYENAVAAYEDAKAALDEENAEMLAAKTNFETKQNAYNAAKSAYESATSQNSYAFYEDFEGETNKMGIAFPSGSYKEFTESSQSDSNGQYEKVTVTGQKAFYGTYNSGNTGYTTFKVAKNTDYIVSFRLNQTDSLSANYYYIKGNTSANSDGTAIMPSEYKFNGESKAISTQKMCNLLTSTSKNLNAWNNVEIIFNSGDYEYIRFYFDLRLVADSTQSVDILFDDFKVISKENYNAITTTQENLIAAKCEYAVAFEAYKPFVADKLDQFAEAVQIADAHYIENVCDEAIVEEATCTTAGKYYKNCPYCARCIDETFEVATNSENHKNTEYVYNSMNERVLHCNDCGNDIKTETVYGLADANCNGDIDICDLVKLDNALKSSQALNDNVDLDKSGNIDTNDFELERKILTNAYTNVALSSSNGNTFENDTTFNAKDMWSALCVVADGGTVSNSGTYEIINEDFELKTYGKQVTITGGTLDFSKKSVVNFRGNVELKDIAVNWNTASNSEVFANGYNVTIGENVTTNGRLDRIYGGVASGTIESTNLTLLSGNYNWIYGSNKAGTVSGVAKLHVGGSVNAELTDSQIKNHSLAQYYVIGGGRLSNSTVNNVELTIDGNAKMFKVYAAGVVGTVTGKAKLSYGGSAKAMSLFGGFYNEGGSVTHTEVTMTGGWTEQIFGGNEKSGMTNENSSTKVTVTGGTITRRIYGGCYNEIEKNQNFTVNGTTELYLLNVENSFTQYDSILTKDNTISAGSRIESNPTSEKSKLYITQSLFDKYSSKFGEVTGYAYDSIEIIPE